jgi:hypothetical protein
MDQSTIEALITELKRQELVEQAAKAAVEKISAAVDEFKLTLYRVNPEAGIYQANSESQSTANGKVAAKPTASLTATVQRKSKRKRSPTVASEEQIAEIQTLLTKMHDKDPNSAIKPSNIKIKGMGRGTISAGLRYLATRNEVQRLSDGSYRFVDNQGNSVAAD